MNQPRFLSGQMLLAMPGIGDPRFEHAVVAICSHDDQGALGIGVSQAIASLTLHGLLTQIGIDPGVAPDVPVHLGGPVEPRRGFVLHGQDWGGQDTLHVGSRWALTGTLDVLRAISEGRGPERFIVSLGYAGWSAGQLDEELTRHGWFATPGTDELLFDQPAAERWGALFRDAGVDTRMLASEAGHA